MAHFGHTIESQTSTQGNELLDKYATTSFSGRISIAYRDRAVLRPTG
jgi:hypothetical protein